MNEIIRSHPERPNGDGAGFFDSFPSTDPLVTVSSGPYLEQLPVGNSTVGEIRRRFADRFDIDPRAQAVLDGVQVDDQTTVRPGQALMFTRRAGEKGYGAMHLTLVWATADGNRELYAQTCPHPNAVCSSRFSVPTAPSVKSTRKD